MKLRACLATVVLWLGILGLHAAPAAAAGCANPVACENALPGDPMSDWEVDGSGDPTIQGFATSMSVNVGQTESFKINTPSPSYHIDILRLGYYGGDGARKIAANIKPSASLPQSQPACNHDATNGLIDCGNWSVSASWTVPANAVSGVYIAHLVRDDSKDPGGDSQIPFVVRNDASHSQIVVATSDATWEAYNDYGGNSLYTCTVSCPPGNPLAYKAAYAVSYNRPFDGALSTDQGASYLYYAEYQMVRWLEENGYDVSYVSDSDLDRTASVLLNHKLFMSSGHDEYWSGNELANVKTALAAGVNLAFFSGNEIFWKTRWANSEDGSNTPYRTLVSYKETHFNGPVDPNDPPTWTGAWADPRFSPPGDGGLPANALTGQMFEVNSGSADITVPYQYSKLRLWRGTAVAKLSSGQTLTLDKGGDTLGYEWDVDADNGFRPAGEIDMSSTTVNNVQPFLDYGSTTGTGTETHHLTLYRAPSGALVFGAGTVQWSWGLDNTNAWGVFTTDPSGNAPDPTMEQATVNLFADMGVQPTTLIAGLTPATPSSDITPPTSSITSPTGGTALSDGTATTISGTATDAGGGVVAGVEVSTDGGATWHPATVISPDSTTVDWTYNWTAQGNPQTTIMSRATDDSGNIEKPSAGVTVKVSCPCSLWGAGTPGGAPDSGDGNAVTVGMKFQSDSFGTVTALRFYKVTADTGTHVGSLWSSTGTLLASATFTNESASGWQQVTLSQPVTIMPHTTYVVSYFAPNGHYAATSDYFYPDPAPGPLGGGDYNNAPLHAVPNNTSANGLFVYGANAFPTGTYLASNYWVDVMFSPAAVPGGVSGVSATAGKAQATVSWSAPTSGGPVTSYVITPYIGASAQPTTTVTGSPPNTTATIRGLTAGASYTFTVAATNPNGSGPASAASNAVTPAAATAPSAPANVTASPATGSALVSWSAPTDDGGSSLTGYTITPYIGTTAQPAVKVTDPTATSNLVTGLTNGTAYTFVVAATNAVGTGPGSSASPATTPADTIFDFATPTTPDAGDGNAVNLGVAFKSDQAGWITGVRFYKSAANTGTHVGALWTTSGTLLASATFTNETASGWQQVSFPTPIAVSPGQTYIASYYAPNGHYAAAANGLSAAVNNTPLHTIANGTTANGVFAYASTNSFPNGTWNASNYYVDTTFIPNLSAQVPSAPTGIYATPATSSAQVNWVAPTSDGGTPINGYTVTPHLGSAAQTPVTVQGSSTTSAIVPGLTNGSAYTFTVTANNGVGSSTASAASAAVTPEDTIFDFGTPVTLDSGDGAGVTLGVKFSATVSGLITGIRFYKAPANTGTHVAALWDTSGDLLASANFSGETASGWQQVLFSSPVPVTAGTTYIASYFAPNGHYSVTGNAFGSLFSNPPLQAIASGTSPNGVYAYGNASTFPNSTYNSANYWVDVLFDDGS